MKTLYAKRAFEVKFYGSTNYKGSRVAVIDKRFNNKKIVFSWDYSLGTASYQQAQYHLEKMGFELEAVIELDNSYLLITNDFDTEFRKVD